MVKIFPSLISSNLICIKESIELLEPYCDGFHLDVMDNHFVPNLTFGADTVHAIAEATKKQIWVHLMVDDPINWCKTLHLPAGSLISFHFEATKDARMVSECITEKKWIPSIAINPKTAAHEIFPLLNIINHVLVMSVQPGFSGQRFLQEVVLKIHELKKEKPDLVIGMDGGINVDNIREIVAAGVQDVAAAAAIFSSNDPVAAIKKLRDIAEEK